MSVLVVLPEREWLGLKLVGVQLEVGVKCHFVLVVWVNLMVLGRMVSLNSGKWELRLERGEDHHLDRDGRG